MVFHLSGKALSPRSTLCFFVFLFFFILCLWMFAYHMCAWCQGDQRRALDPLELVVKMAVSCHVGGRNCLSPGHLGENPPFLTTESPPQTPSLYPSHTRETPPECWLLLSTASAHFNCFERELSEVPRHFLFCRSLPLWLCHLLISFSFGLKKVPLVLFIKQMRWQTFSFVFCLRMLWAWYDEV